MQTIITKYSLCNYSPLPEDNHRRKSCPFSPILGSYIRELRTMAWEGGGEQGCHSYRQTKSVKRFGCSWAGCSGEEYFKTLSKLNPLHTRIVCARFGWNWPICFWFKVWKFTNKQTDGQTDIRKTQFLYCLRHASYSTYMYMI